MKKLRFSGLTRSKGIILLFVVLFAVIGVNRLIVSRALTPTASFEPESATVVTPAKTVNDTSASGSAAVQFSVASATRTCTNPVFVTSNTNGGWSNGGYYVHNNMWNASSGETLYACAYNNWYVTANYPNTTDVKTYPNVHLDINNLNGRPLSNYSTITSTFGATSPHVGIYNVAYDVWLNGVGWGGGTTELMIWTENYKQVPLGSKSGTVTFSGQTFDTYHYNDGNANVISLVATPVILNGNIDLKAIFDWSISKGWLPANSTVNQIGYGVEICSTNNQPATFYFNEFSVTMN